MNWFPLVFTTVVLYVSLMLTARAVITGVNTDHQSVADLEGTPIGISRIGSGSQTMAYVMAQQQGWSTDTLQFKGTSVHVKS